MEVEKLKKLLGKEEVEDNTIFQFLLDDVKEIICNYCNIKEIPEGLKNTAYRMAMDLYRNEQIGSEENPVMVTSVTTGDTSTSFSNQTTLIKDTILKQYTKQLNRYRKLVF